MLIDTSYFNFPKILIKSVSALLNLGVTDFGVFKFKHLLTQKTWSQKDDDKWVAGRINLKHTGDCSEIMLITWDVQNPSENNGINYHISHTSPNQTAETFQLSSSWIPFWPTSNLWSPDFFSSTVWREVDLSALSPRRSEGRLRNKTPFFDAQVVFLFVKSFRVWVWSVDVIFSECLVILKIKFLFHHNNISPSICFGSSLIIFQHVFFWQKKTVMWKCLGKPMVQPDWHDY